jgi:hypothetical protein
MIVAATIRLLTVLAVLVGEVAAPSQPARVVNLVADHNSTFRLEGPNNSELDLIAGEPITLHVEARKAKSMNRDGSVHGLVLLDAHHNPVPGWELMFKPGVQEMQLTAPADPGVYEAVCTVICSTDHERMKFRVVVHPR